MNAKQEHTVPAHPARHTAPSTDYRIIIVLSLLLSVWLIAIDPVLNKDAILYLRSAQAYLQDGVLASQRLFARPLLPICFALVHQLTGIPLVYAGLLLTSVYYAILCVAFVATVATLGGNRRVQLFAAIVVLSHPALNDQRSSIVRDPAYWGLILLAFRELLLYLRNPTLRHQLLWTTYILLASLFRFEGLFFALLAPLSLLAARDFARRGRRCLQLLLPVLPVLGATVVVFLLYQQGADSGARPGGGIANYLQRLLSFPGQFNEIAAVTAQSMLDLNSREDASLAVLAGLTAILLVNICRALSWPWTLLLLWGTRAHQVPRLRHDDAVLLLAHMLIALLYLAAFTLINHFMLDRYAGQFAIFGLLFLPFILDAIWSTGRRSLRIFLVGGLLLLMSLDTLHNNDYQKAFIRDAGNWLLENTPADASLVSNNHYLAYISMRQFDWDLAASRKFTWQKLLAPGEHWQSRDYLAMRIEPQDVIAWERFLRLHGLTETIVFEGGRRGKVCIVQLPRTGIDSER